MQKGNQFPMMLNFVTLHSSYATVILEADSPSYNQKFFICYGIKKCIAVFIGAQTWTLLLASTIICTHVLLFVDPD
jgi:hypothetical protein